MRKDRDQILLAMVREYPGYFLEKFPKGRKKNQSILKEIAEKYGRHLRVVQREKKMAMSALKLALKNGRTEINLSDIIAARKKSMRTERYIELGRLFKLLREIDPKLAAKVMKKINSMKGRKIS